MSERRFKTFAEFYPFYLSEHRKRGTRITHFIGTTLFILLFIAAVWNLSALRLLSGVILAYGFAWIGHYFIEKNRPATFQYPLWSLISDFKLYFQILGGKESFTSGEDLPPFSREEPGSSSHIK
jgi:hypothetical protein